MHDKDMMIALHSYHSNSSFCLPQNYRAPLVERTTCSAGNHFASPAVSGWLAGWLFGHPAVTLIVLQGIVFVCGITDAFVNAERTDKRLGL